MTHALNLSTRMRVQSGDGVGIGGFIITGIGPKHIIVRAIGPSLLAFGIPDGLPDPVLELHGPGGFVTITNDNWKDSQQAEIQATGIAPVNDFESAIIATLNPGAYTSIVRDRSNQSGVALVEVYDLDQGAYSKLANMSTRALVSTGENVVISGFLLREDNLTDHVVIRGIGPSLAPNMFPITSVLADPSLELRDSNGELVASNNNWPDDPWQAAELRVLGLAPASHLESAISTNLPPGLYTVLLSGTNNGTGIGLIEVYECGDY
jgi:hypothetical protein